MSSGDFSKFDTTVDFLLTKISFSLIYHLLDLSDYEKSLFSVVTSFFHNSRIYHPVTSVFSRRRGVISGSYFTNMVDSFVNQIVLNYTLISLGYTSRIRTTGDDSLIETTSKINSAKVSDFVDKNFGMIVNFEEEDYYPPGTEGFTYLGSR